MFNLTTRSESRLLLQSAHPLSPEDPGWCLAHLICAGDLVALAVGRQASDLSVCPQRTCAEQLTGFSGRALPRWACGAAGTDLLVLAAGAAALLAPPWDAEHCMHWPVTVGGQRDIKAPWDPCRLVSPQICRSLGCWGEAGAGQGSSRRGGHHPKLQEPSEMRWSRQRVRFSPAAESMQQCVGLGQ